MLPFKEFVEKLKTIPAKVTTEGTAVYNDVKLRGDTITYWRGSREFYGGKRRPLVEKLIVKELFDIYQNLDSIDKNKVRLYLSRKQYIVAVAFLKAIGLYDKNGNRIH